MPYSSVLLLTSNIRSQLMGLQNVEELERDMVVFKFSMFGNSIHVDPTASLPTW